MQAPRGRGGAASVRTRADREVQRTLMELLRQLVGCDLLGKVGCKVATCCTETTPPDRDIRCHLVSALICCPQQYQRLLHLPTTSLACLRPAHYALTPHVAPLPPPLLQVEMITATNRPDLLDPALSITSHMTSMRPLSACCECACVCCSAGQDDHGHQQARRAGPCSHAPWALGQED